MTQDNSAAAPAGRRHLRADLLVLDADPLDHVENLTHVAAVFKGGTRVA